MGTVSEALVGLLKRIDLLEGVDDATLERLAHAGDLVEFQPGEYVVHQGEYGDSFFVLLNGHAKVQVVGDDGRARDIDELKAGRYFGELAIVGHGERLASVQCLSGSELLELRTATFENCLRKYKEVRRRIEAVFVRESIHTFIRQSRYFRDLPEEMRDQIVGASTLVHHSKGDVIAKENDPAQNLYVVRAGFVRVSRTLPREDREEKDRSASVGSLAQAARGSEADMATPSRRASVVDDGEDGNREEVVAYLGPEDFFGDQEIAAGAPYATTAVAVEPVECLVIPRSVVWKIYAEHPEVFSTFRRYQLTRSEMQRDIIGSNTAMGFVRDVLDAGLGQARSALIINMDACVRCGNCVQACDDLHGYSRIARRGKKMTRRVELESRRHENLYFPTSCLQCASPECMVGCPTGAISRDPGGEVYIKDTCIGCGNCARNCDFGNISMAKAQPFHPSIFDMLLGGARGAGGVESKSSGAEREASPGSKGSGEAKEKADGKSDLIAVKCDVCFEREFASCVYNCPTNAISRIDPRFYFDELLRIAPKLAMSEGIERGAKTAPKRPTGFVDLALDVLVVIASALVGYAGWLELKPSSWSGIGLVAGVLGFLITIALALLGVRKRLRTYKLGSLASWSRIHSVLGGVLYGLALFHAGYQATSLLTGLLLLALTLATVVGVIGQVVSLVIPRVLARTEDEALLPEDVAGRVKNLLRSNAEYVAVLQPQAKRRVMAQARRLAWGGFRMLRKGVSPRQIAPLLERRAKKLPPLGEAEHAIALRIAENLSISRLHTARRVVEAILVSWGPLHLVSSAMAFMFLMGHLMTVILW